MSDRKKVVLLGDSIRLIGYGKPVSDALSDEYEVWQPEENCRYAKHTLRMLWDHGKHIRDCDVIHWNNGLWDICDIFGDGTFTSLEEYVDTMCRIARLLTQRSRVVIFATTTPVREGHPYNDTAEIARYNEALVPRLREIGVVINDLFATVAEDTERYILESDKIHLSSEGIAVCARQVEEIIRSEAEKL